MLYSLHEKLFRNIGILDTDDRPLIVRTTNNIAAGSVQKAADHLADEIDIAAIGYEFSVLLLSGRQKI